MILIGNKNEIMCATDCGKHQARSATIAVVLVVVVVVIVAVAAVCHMRIWHWGKTFLRI